jgi:16S rRNA processing protein RimM
MADPSGTDGLVEVGRIIGLHGVRGWVKVYAYTREREAILDYDHWYVRRNADCQRYEVAEGRVQGPGVVARLAGFEDRTAASSLVGADVLVTRDQLPPLEEGEYYWSQLEGLKVVNLAGEVLGEVSHLVETGANDVLVVQGERERLIPYTSDAVKRVDLNERVITVDWDADF